MSQTLYRKYRSQRFADIIGQAPVVRILQNSIVRGRLNHAYLFAGPRGTGKTSIARIFAKALNCLNPQEGDACGVCAICQSIATGTAVDVIEIDAASNRGIDDIRDLRERVNYAPLELKHKVYIIDEVHMITGPAWNALLKTLEEPPAHVIFCLCTTEANKVPITILSRCIRFDFQRLPLDALAAHLESIATAEGFSLEPECGMKLARLAEGSARDAISLLDQLTVFCDSCITASDIEELFQLGDPSHVRAVVDSLLAGDSAHAIEAWEGMLARGVDAGTFLLQLSEELKSRYLADPQPQAKSALEAIWQGLNLLKYDNFPALLVELTLIQASSPAIGNITQPVEQRMPTPRVAPTRPVIREQAEPPREQVEIPRHGSSPQPAVAGTPTPASLAVTSDDSDLDFESGDELLRTFRDKVHGLRITTAVLLLRGVTAVRDGNRLVLSFDEEHRQALSYAGSQDNLGVLREAARQLYGQHTVIELRRAGDVPDRDPALAPVEVPPAPAASPNQPEAIESTGSNGAGDRPATFEDALRIFGGSGEQT